MSECTSSCVLSESDACHAIATAVSEGVKAEPLGAAVKVIDSLKFSFGPIVERIVALIETGVNSLPAIIEALQAAGISLPPWVNVVATILIAVLKQQ